MRVFSYKVSGVNDTNDKNSGHEGPNLKKKASGLGKLTDSEIHALTGKQQIVTWEPTFV